MLASDESDPYENCMPFYQKPIKAAYELNGPELYQHQRREIDRLHDDDKKNKLELGSAINSDRSRTSQRLHEDATTQSKVESVVQPVEIDDTLLNLHRNFLNRGLEPSQGNFSSLNQFNGSRNTHQRSQQEKKQLNSFGETKERTNSYGLHAEDDYQLPRPSAVDRFDTLTGQDLLLLGDKSNVPSRKQNATQNTPIKYSESNQLTPARHHTSDKFEIYNADCKTLPYFQ